MLIESGNLLIQKLDPFKISRSVEALLAKARGESCVRRGTMQYNSMGSSKLGMPAALSIEKITEKYSLSCCIVIVIVVSPLYVWPCLTRPRRAGRPGSVSATHIGALLSALHSA